MIPESLRMKGFLSYKEDTTISLTGIHLLGIIGKNGHGKSSWLDAITFALFGKTRYKDADQSINDNVKENLVEYTFALEEDRYKVERRKKLKGKSSVHFLTFYLHQGEDWISIGSKNSVDETQKKIIKVLNLDYDTFVNSAFLLQNKIDSFTVMESSKRRKIFEDIIGLGIYTDIQKLAVEERRSVKRQIENVIGDIQDLDLQIEKEEELKENSEALKKELGEVEAEIGGYKEQEERYQNLMSLIREKEGKLGNLRDDIKSKIAERNELTAKNGETENSISEKRSIMSNSEQITKSLNFFNSLREQLQELADLKSSYDAVALSLSEAQNSFNQSSMPLLERIQKSKTELSTLERALNIKKECEEKLAYLSQAEVECAEIVNTKLPALSQEREQLNAQLSTLNSSITVNETAVQELRKKYSKIQQFGGLCPLTEDSCPVLTADHVAASLERIKAEGVQLEAVIQKQKQQQAALNNEQGRIASDESVLISRRENVNRELLGKQMLERDFNQAVEAEKVIDVIREGYQKDTLEYDSMKTDFERRSSELSLQLNEFGYDAQLHGNTQQQFDLMKKEKIEEKVEELKNIESEISNLAEQQEFYRGQINGLNEQITSIDENGKSLRAEIASDNEKLGEFSGLKEKMEELNSKRDGINISIGGVQHKIDECQKAKEKKKEFKAKVKQEEDEIYVLNELVDACDLEKGIPAQIIEAAVPEVEVHANKLLASFGSSHRIEFSFEKKNKTNAKVKSDFGINIITPGERPRPFDGYSGGQKVFISLAIRLGISFLLVQRASRKFEFMALDESFSALDEENRQTMISAVIKLKERFKMIWVISHLEEIKEMSDVLYKVKMPSEEIGSKIEMIN